jgi:hypothetical protein
MDLQGKVADLRGLQVANVTLRGTRLAVALTEAGREYPWKWIIECEECFAFSDDGISAAPLVQGTYGPLGAAGKSLSQALHPGTAVFELQLWNKADAVVPKFRAVARAIQVRAPKPGTTQE